jgi:GNAT acetyltransferase-like protein
LRTGGGLTTAALFFSSDDVHQRLMTNPESRTPNPEPVAAAFPFADLALARRLERAEGMANVRAVELRARVAPASGATWTEIAGALAMFDGVGSPITQTFGLGMRQPPTARDLEALEAFFAERGAETHHEVSPLADAATFDLLTARGYRPFEFTSVMYLALAGRDGRDGQDGPDAPDAPDAQDRQNGRGRSAVTVRNVTPADAEVYARTSAEGWRQDGHAEFMYELQRANAESQAIDLFLAELDGRPIATAALVIQDGVALLAGASTIPDGRQRGAQNALLAARLRYGADRGCDLAMMGALPGSGSQRNAERNGFRIAYTRIKWRCGGTV